MSSAGGSTSTLVPTMIRRVERTLVSAQHSGGRACRTAGRSRLSVGDNARRPTRAANVDGLLPDDVLEHPGMN